MEAHFRCLISVCLIYFPEGLRPKGSALGHDCSIYIFALIKENKIVELFED